MALTNRPFCVENVRLYQAHEQFDAKIWLKRRIFRRSQDPKSLIFNAGLRLKDQNHNADPELAHKK